MRMWPSFSPLRSSPSLSIARLDPAIDRGHACFHEFASRVAAANRARLLYQKRHIKHPKMHLTVISIEANVRRVTSVGRRAALPCASKWRYQAATHLGGLSHTSRPVASATGTDSRASDVRPATDFITKGEKQ